MTKSVSSQVWSAAALLCALQLCGCVSSGSLPQSASAVNFGAASEGKTGWSAYRQHARFERVTRDEVYEAAKAGLGAVDFALVSADVVQGVVIGEHGMTLHDWNVVAGVYFREREQGFDVVVLVEGSKDIGFSGDVTGGGWTGRILTVMRQMLSRPS